MTSPKRKIRNPKQCQSTNDQNSKQNEFWYLNLEFCILNCNFDFSDLNFDIVLPKAND